MPGAAQHTIPLPKGWPRRVRSAVIEVISLAHLSLIATRSWAANSWNARIRLKSENARLRQEVALLREEGRIKDARMARIPAQRRPHYTPLEMLAIPELRAARGWSQAQTAERLLVTPLTVASWMSRLDEGGPRAILQICRPVNKFPDFVGYIVRRLKILCAPLEKAKIARILCRTGLLLGSMSVRRMLRDAPRKPPAEACVMATRIVTARRPNHVWHLDLTTVPTPSASGPPGCPSLCRSDGPSAGGSLSPSITTPGVSSASGSSPENLPLRPFASSLTTRSARTASHRGIS